MKKLIRENLFKNAILLIVLALSYLPIKNFLFSTELVTDKPLAGDLLVAISIIAVTACFGNFAFTYEKIKARSVGERLLAHVTTGLLMLLIGLALEMTAVLSEILIGNFVILDISLIILYLASVCYDFWDLARMDLRFL